MSSVAKQALHEKCDWMVWSLVTACRLMASVILGIYALFIFNLERPFTDSPGVDYTTLIIGIGLALCLAYQLMQLIPLEKESILSKMFSAIVLKIGAALPFLLQAIL